jgi:hypothetical protein
MFGVLGRVGDEYTGDGLLLQLLAGVPVVDPGARPEFGDGGRAGPVEGGVEPESRAKPDPECLALVS